MTRPSLFQTILNRPSQSYVLPQDRAARQEALPVAADALRRSASPAGERREGASPRPSGSTTTHISSSSHASLSPSASISVPSQSTLSAQVLGGTEYNNNEDNEDDDDDDDDGESSQDVFYTPNSSPRASLASSSSNHMSFAAATAVPTPRKVSRRSLRSKTLAQQPSPPDQHRNADEPKPDLASPSAPMNSNNLNATTNSVAARTNAHTAITPTGPASSPALSPARIAVPSTRTPSRSNSLNKHRPLPNSRSAFDPGSAASAAPEQPQGRPLATASMADSASSMSSNSLDGHSVFSDLLTETTGATTAPPDGNGAKKDHSFPASDATRRWVGKGGYPSGHATKATTTPAAPSTTQPKRKPTKSHTYHGLGAAATTPLSTFTGPNLHQRYQHQQQRNRDKHTSTVMMSMTAVLEAAEEDELYRNGQKNGSPASEARQLLKQHKDDNRKASAVSGYDAVAGIGTRATPRGSRERNRAATFQAFPSHLDGEQRERGRDRRGHSSQYVKHQPITPSPLSAPSKPAATSSSSKQQFLQVPTPSRPKLGHRRSRSLGLDGTSTRLRRSDSPKSHTTLLRSDSPARSHGRAHSVSLSAGTAATELLSALPKSSGELPSNGTAGYTSLVLPRAPPPLNLDNNNPSHFYRSAQNKMGVVGAGEGRVDLTKNGMAQTTMASVEVVRGLGSVAGRKGLLMGLLPLNLPLVRRKTVSDRLDLTERTSRRSEDQGGFSSNNGAAGLAEGVGVGNGPVLGFTSYRKPPGYVPSGSVLVQVWAVGVDGVDGRLVGVRMLHGVRAPPVPPAAAAPATSVARDQGQPTAEEGSAVEEQRLEGGDAEKRSEMSPIKAKGLGLGRSLSLRERLSRSVSLGRSAGRASLQQHRQRQHSPDKQQQQSPEKQENGYTTATTGGGGTTAVASVGYIPGRSFVGRVVECGWEVRGEAVRKGEWVAGLLDVKKCGALTEFIVVDRHRIHRVPHPNLLSPNGLSPSPFPPSSPSISSTGPTQHSLTLEELALLPLCGVPAYRAVRTFTYAFSSMRDNLSSASVSGGASASVTEKAKNRAAAAGAVDPHPSPNLAAYGTMFSRFNLGDHENGRRRRALVLRGHDGIGAVAVQMLVLRGWRVCVHVPFIASPPNVPTTSAVADRFMEEVEERIRKWGAEEVIFDDGEVVGMDEGRRAVARVLDGLKDDGDVFDAVLDTVGGKVVREAAERLLRSPGRRGGGGSDLNGNRNGNGLGKNGKSGVVRPMGQFTTVVGDNPERAIPSAGDLFRAGLRSLKFGGGGGGGGGGGVTSSGADAERKGGSSENLNVQNNNGKSGKVGYAWVNISQDVDWEGKDVGETIGSVVDLALEYGVKPWVGAEFATTNGVGAGGRGMGSTPAGMPAESSVGAVVEQQERGHHQEEQPLHWEGRRTVPFEKVPEIFVDGGPLSSGGTVVVRIAA